MSIVLSDSQSRVISAMAHKAGKTPAELIDEFIVDYMVKRAYETGTVDRLKSELFTNGEAN